ncbi:MFS transporter [Streptomyces sp. ME19-01-6]|uniref:MFS transporter n=1 Tax=Streptomyces sp. ME19-01-6 TaxID=3028686 RepID=UPI0029B59B57|nr:MFS transporter [Streptomyces sp. ME19-01-6]MDX3233166.1 MFS transporter [Streptomyces sp. ME19-01-6]
MSYLALLRAPYVARLLVGSWIGRLPFSMAALSIPLVLRQAGATYRFVGVAAGIFAVSAAVGAPLLGRLVDRIGQVRVLAVTAVIAGVGFIGICVAPQRPAVVLAAVFLAGVATPPLEPCVRALWPDIVPSERLDSAYALDSGAQELIFVGGPLAVAGCTALFSPTAVLWTQALLGVVGVLVVATAPPSRQWRAAQRSTNWLGALRSPGLVVLLAGLIGVGTSIGTLNVLTVYYAEHHYVVGGASALLSLNAAGALFGVLAYGARRWSMPLPRRAVTFAGGLAVGYTLLILLPSPPLMVVLMLLTGLSLAPLLTVCFTLVGDLAPPGTTTEAFAWLVTLFCIGTSVGSTIAGSVLEQSGEHWAAACGSIGATVCLLILTAGRARLAPGASDVAQNPAVPNGATRT